MSQQRIYNLASNSKCFLCESLGLQGLSSYSGDLESALADSHYSHLGLGCRASELKLKNQKLKILRYVHDVTGLSRDSSAEFCLVQSNLDSNIFILPPPKEIKRFVLIPENGHRLLPRIRKIHKDWQNIMTIMWPHPKFLGRLGWSWIEVCEMTNYLSLASPLARIGPLEGLDVFNPDCEADLDMEPLPTHRIDTRSYDSKPLSIIIPSYNNKELLLRTLENLFQFSDSRFEVIVVDDGSSDHTFGAIEAKRREMGSPSNFVFLKLSRPRTREMGQGGFRAGVSRNCAVRESRAELLLFLDSDILIPESYIQELIVKHGSADLIQARRRQITRKATESGLWSFDAVNVSRDLEVSTGVWDDFNTKTLDWDSVPYRWKFVSTFCLSVKRKDFFELGGFRKSFVKYGFEDTDLGYRASHANLRFFLSDQEVYHFKHSDGRSEYGNNLKKKEELLKDSCRMFFLNNPSPEVMDSHAKYII